MNTNNTVLHEDISDRILGSHIRILALLTSACNNASLLGAIAQ